MNWLTALACLTFSAAALAHGVNLNVPKHAQWQEECGSCHIAYPPQFLTADNWQRMMNTLDKHFGPNAELDAASQKSITDFLKRNAAKGSKHQARSLRISDTAWFKREHHEIPRDAWKDPRIKSAANCNACHVEAERGDWSEDGVRMPKGIHEVEDEGDDD